MPAERKEQIGRLPSGKWQLRYFDEGCAPLRWRIPLEVRRQCALPDEIEPGLERKASRSARPNLLGARRRVPRASRDRRETQDDHALRGGSSSPQTKFGTVPLVELEGMADEIAGFAVGLPERLRYPIMAAFRQALEAGVRYGYMTRNPAKLARPNPMPAPREIRVYTAGRAEGGHGRTRNRRERRCDVRRRYRAQTLGVGVDRAQRRRQGPPGGPRAGNQDAPLSARGAAHVGGAHRARHGSPRLDSHYVFTTSRTCPGRASRGRSMSRTSGGANGGRRSTPPGSRSQHASTTYGRRSPRTRSRPESPCSSSPGSWAPARR